MIISETLSPAKQTGLTIFTLMLPIFLGGLDTTITNSIGTFMQFFSTAQMQWFIDIYSIDLAASIVIASRCGDRWGRRQALIVGLVLFALSSLGCILSGETIFSIVFRGIQGVAYALMISSVVTSIRAIFNDPKKRTQIYGIWTLASSIGAGLGPILGHLLAQRYCWQSAFIINIPLVILSVICVIKFLPDSRSPGKNPLHIRDGILSIISLACIIGSLQVNGPIWLRIGIFLCGAFVGILFCRRQYTEKSPLINFQLFTIQQFTLSAIIIIAAYAGYTGLIYFITHSNLNSRAYLGIVIMVIAIAISGLAVTKFNHLYRPSHILILALILESIGFFCITFTYRAILFLIATTVAGLGIGIAYTIASATLINAVEPRDSGPAGAVQETSFALGAALGVAIIGSLINAVGTSMTVILFGVVLAILAGFIFLSWR